MRPDPRPLVRKLTPTARRHLESALTSAALSQHAELTVEHVVRALAADPTGDVAQLLSVGEREQLLVECERALSRVAAGASRPSLSDALLRWFEHAWSVASLDWNDDAIRSGALLVASVELASRTPGVLAAIGSMPLDRLRADRAHALAASPEHAEARAGTPPGSTTMAATPMLARFTTSLTERARRGEIDPVLGRARETQQMIDVLCRRRKNNPVLVGEPGVGKTAVVEGLALAIVRREVPEALREVELVALDLGLLEAGASARGEMEARLLGLIREVRESPKPIVVFIDEAHTLVGAQPSGGTDAANLLKPALARGELRTIAATTFREHKKYFEKDAALDRRFQKIVVEEPDESTAMTILRGLVPTYERTHGVIVRDEAVEAAVRLAKRYVAGRQLPDSCVDVLDTAAARVRGSQAAPPLALVEADAAIAAAERELAALERDRIEPNASPTDIADARRRLAAARGARVELAAHWHAQRDAMERLLAARAALSSEASSANDPQRRAREIDVRVAREAFDVAVGDRALVAAEVDADAIAATVEVLTGAPIADIHRTRADTMRTLESALDRRVLGQPQATRTIAQGLRISEAKLRRTDAPAGVFLLVGPSGVGKTETAHAIADLLFGGERFLTTINLSEYQEKHTVSRLVGAPPGYVGYGEGGKLTEAVRQRPHSVVLLDECEKADLEVMNTFYQLFDRGVLTDGEGRVVDFRSTVLMLTSNLASDRISKLFESGVSDAGAIESEIRPILAAHFAPALLGRMSVVPYLPLADDALGAIADLELARVTARVGTAHGVTLRFDESIRERMVSAARDSSMGVRHLRGMLERHVLGPLACELLTPRDAPAARAIDVGVGTGDGFSFTWSLR